MSDTLKPTTTISGEKILSSFALNKNDLRKLDPGINPAESFEVFRNNTTAIEVIIKDVKNKNKKKNNDKQETFEDFAISILQANIMKLESELGDTKFHMDKMKIGFNKVIVEMNKQLQIAHKRDLENSLNIVTLKLENEKLKTLLQSKTNLVIKLKKELTSLKKVLKYVIKSLSNIPKCPNNWDVSSDPDYEDFEKELSKEAKVKFVSGTLDGTLATFNSTYSKDPIVTSYEA